MIPENVTGKIVTFHLRFTFLGVQWNNYPNRKSCYKKEKGY